MYVRHVFNLKKGYSALHVDTILVSYNDVFICQQSYNYAYESHASKEYCW